MLLTSPDKNVKPLKLLRSSDPTVYEVSALRLRLSKNLFKYGGEIF